MKNTYAYQLPFNNNLWKLIGFFAIISLIGMFVPFEIHTNKYNLSNKILLFGGLLFTFLFLLIAVVLKQKSNNSKLNPYKLELTETYLQFPIGKADVQKINFVDIASVSYVGNEMNGEILQVKPKNNAKSLFIQGKGFVSAQEFKEFEENLTKQINHYTIN